MLRKALIGVLVAVIIGVSATMLAVRPSGVLKGDIRDIAVANETGLEDGKTVGEAELPV